MVKEQTAGKSGLSKTQENVDSLSRRGGVKPNTLERTQAKMGQGGISNLKETRNKTKIGSESENQALSANIDELECQIKSSNLSSSDKAAKKR